MTRKILVVSLLLLAVVVSIMAQGSQQAKLLRKAYRTHSTKILYDFFDNWSEAVQSNEKEATNPYVAEAHKVFAACYQPLKIDSIFYPEDRLYCYRDKPYFIVQGSLRTVEVAECIPYKPEEIDSFIEARIRQMYEDDSTRNREIEKNRTHRNIPSYYKYYIPSYAIVPSTIVDSAVSFRPPVHFDGKKVVYLTDGYEKLLNSFLGNCYVELGKRNIMQAAFSKGTSRLKQKFFSKAALIFYGHWGGYWEYVTFPETTSVIFNPEMTRAVVKYSLAYEGGEMILEKRDGKWEIVSVRFCWII